MSRGLDEPLVQFALYDHPRDFPSGFVLRRWIIDRHGSVTPDTATTHATIEEARAAVPHGLVRIARFPGDDPCIVEVWT